MKWTWQVEIIEIYIGKRLLNSKKTYQHSFGHSSTKLKPFDIVEVNFNFLLIPLIRERILRSNVQTCVTKRIRRVVYSGHVIGHTPFGSNGFYYS